VSDKENGFFVLIPNPQQLILQHQPRLCISGPNGSSIKMCRDRISGFE
jgi:hypothetical protein